jgi:glutamate dehydrogenase
LLVAGLARDFQQMRFDFLRTLAQRRQAKAGLLELIAEWADGRAATIRQFRTVVGRAQESAPVAPAMLAQIASQARSVLKR